MLGKVTKVSRDVWGVRSKQREDDMLVMEGFSNCNITEKLFVCEQTVKEHLHDIFKRPKYTAAAN